jgi:crotonobetainyl-CoA:carnitine CoA-transferase CaiB-like acyl-CoA transferase
MIMAGPLTGIRVIDCTVALAGPYCGLVLADLGADVIKVENPDPKERKASGLAAYRGEDGHFLVTNRNKRGLAIDLKSDAGRECFYELVRSADVLVQNFRPGVMKRLKCDWETLQTINPRLVYCSISGFGEGSPYAGLAGLDLIAQGMSGLMSVTGNPDDTEPAPVKAGTPVTDMGAGMYGAIGVISALYHRESSGRGQHVESTLLDTPLSWLTWRAAEYWDTGEIPELQGSGRGAYRAFKCADGRWVNIGANNRLFPAGCRTLGLPELVDDPRFADPIDRIENHRELAQLFQEAFLTKSSDEWIALFQETGIPVGPIKNVAEALDDPHTHQREMVVEVDHPRLGRMKTLGVPVKLSETPGKVERAAPLLGQHTWEILQDLGYSESQVREWFESGVVYSDTGPGADDSVAGNAGVEPAQAD